MFDPRTGAASGVFVLNNLSNPVWAICTMMGALENVTSPETGKLCAQYVGPALRTINFNNLPVPFNPFITAAPPDYMLRYTEDRLRPENGGQPPPPATDPPAVSAYTGFNGDIPAPPGYGPPPGPPGPPPLPMAPDRRTPAADVAEHASSGRGAATAWRRSGSCCRRRMTGHRRDRDIGRASPAGDRVQRDGDRHRLCIPGRELASAARSGRARRRRGDLPRRARECRYARIEFARPDRRCRRRQRRQDDDCTAGTSTSMCRSNRKRSSPRTPSPPSARPACWGPCIWRWIPRPASPRAVDCSREPRSAWTVRQRTRRPRRHCRRWRPWSTAAGWGRSATSCTTSTRRSTGARMSCATCSHASTRSSARFTNSATTSSPPSTS